MLTGPGYLFMGQGRLLCLQLLESQTSATLDVTRQVAHQVPYLDTVSL